MEPRIDSIGEKKMVGRRMKMSLAANKTTELWRSFMQNRAAISNVVGSDLYSLQVFPPDYFSNFSPAREFEKWALVEVTDFDHVPAGMETFTLPAGLYAVRSEEHTSEL